MEPDILPFHSSSPPPLDDDGDGEAGSEEDEFGAFTLGVSCSPPAFAHSTDSPSSLRRPAAAHQPTCSFKHSVKQSQPTSGSSRGHLDADGQGSNAVHLTNGFSETSHNPHTLVASAVGVCSPREETGFADFTVFTEQAAHPWCCGFTPLGGAEQWDGRGPANRICDPAGKVILDSEPRPHCVYKARDNVCTTAKHCEDRVLPLQDHQQPQGTPAALDFPSEEGNPAEEEEGEEEEEEEAGSALQPTEVQEEGRKHREKSVFSVARSFSLCDSASEDLPSFSEDFSFDCPSADLEPNVSSLGSGDQTDWDQTEDEEEETDSNLRQLKGEKGFCFWDQSATQETSATSNQPGTQTGDGSAGCSHTADTADTADAALQSLGSLPPSDSFADFCSAPTQEDGEGPWAEFKDQDGGGTWSQSREQVSSPRTDGGSEEEGAAQHGVSRRNSCQASLSSRVQQLLLTSFPEVEVPSVEGEEEEEEEEEEAAISLGVLVHNQHVAESEEKTDLYPTSQWAQQRMWWPHQDLHSAVGLQFQWGGSHTNRTLLRCLGVDTKNIVFIGTKKQPVSVPAFASSLGMLEPTKDSEPALCSPAHTAVTAPATPAPRGPPAPATQSMQEALPSSQLDCSRRGLSSSQDGCCVLNLDYFGPEEERRSCSSSSSSCSRGNSPPPGVDRELYELTVSRVDAAATGRHAEDTLTRLMSSADRRTAVRRPQQDEELSEEAGAVLSGLPRLAFMQAKVLMFPSVLAGCSSRDG